jgi:hypothetical protein
VYFSGISSVANVICAEQDAQNSAKEFLKYLNLLLYWEGITNTEGRDAPNIRKHSLLSAAIEDFLNE